MVTAERMSVALQLGYEETKSGVDTGLMAMPMSSSAMSYACLRMRTQLIAPTPSE